MAAEPNAKSRIRKALREKRRSLSPQACLFAGHGVYDNLKKYAPLFRAEKIACYLANDGEISLLPVIEALWQRNKTVCLPVLFGSFGNRQMHFAPYFPDADMQMNKYAIVEPAIGMQQRIKPSALDIVLMPLVAFDLQGNRIGMGGGYYDRSFSFLSRRKHHKKPKLIGVAYDFQEVDSIASEVWDLPLDAVVTQSRLIQIS